MYWFVGVAAFAGTGWILRDWWRESNAHLLSFLLCLGAMVSALVITSPLTSFAAGMVWVSSLFWWFIWTAVYSREPMTDEDIEAAEKIYQSMLPEDDAEITADIERDRVRYANKREIDVDQVLLDLERLTSDGKFTGDFPDEWDETEEPFPLAGEYLKKIGIYYTNSEGAKSSRMISKLRFSQNARGRNIIDAYCHKSREVRTFRVDRIEDVVTPDGELVSPYDYFIENAA